MEVGNTFYYTDFSLGVLENALYELSSGKLDFGNRYFLIKTGEQKEFPHSFASGYSNVA